MAEEKIKYETCVGLTLEQYEDLKTIFNRYEDFMLLNENDAKALYELKDIFYDGRV